MSHAPGEQRTLAEIESRLCRSDPAFAAMFSLLGEADRRRRPVGRRLPRPTLGPGGGARLITVLAVGVAFLVTCIAMAMVSAAHATPSHDGHGRGVSPASVYAPGTP
jgi:hypothetical protein